MLKSRHAQALLSWLLGLYLWTALRTTRWRLVGAEHVGAAFAGRPMVVAVWHERLALLPQLWRIGRRLGAPMGVRVLASRHRDGRLIGTLMRRFGVEPVFGSSSRGGGAALRACAEALASGDHVILTPDGPRGPRRVAAPGVAQLAALAGAPVLPTAARTSWHVTITSSWDRMQVPLPFGRGVLVCRPPIEVGADWRAALPRIEAALTAALEEADRLARRTRDGAVATGALAAWVWHGLASLAAPALRMLLLARARRGKEALARLPERRGIDPTPRPAGRLIWFHAASLGETVSLLPVLEALRGAGV